MLHIQVWGIIRILHSRAIYLNIVTHPNQINVCLAIFYYFSQLTLTTYKLLSWCHINKCEVLYKRKFWCDRRNRHDRTTRWLCKDLPLVSSTLCWPLRWLGLFHLVNSAVGCKHVISNDEINKHYNKFVVILREKFWKTFYLIILID